jgi:hypothetical protein
MSRTYGVVWREGMLPPATGKMELLPRALSLEGLADSQPARREIAYDSLACVRVGRTSADRIHGRPTVVVEPRRGPSISIATFDQPGLVGEIVEHLSALVLRAEGGTRTAFVAPLKEGAFEAVRELLETGPPFDPERAQALERHEVFLTPNEVVFLFESPLGGAALEPLLAEPELWRAAASWQDHLAGPPRLADNVYAWTRPHEATDRSHVGRGLLHAESMAF